MSLGWALAVYYAILSNFGESLARPGNPPTNKGKKDVVANLVFLFFISSGHPPLPVRPLNHYSDALDQLLISSSPARFLINWFSNQYGVNHCNLIEYQAFFYHCYFLTVRALPCDGASTNQNIFQTVITQPTPPLILSKTSHNALRTCVAVNPAVVKDRWNDVRLLCRRFDCFFRLISPRKRRQ